MTTLAGYAKRILLAERLEDKLAPPPRRWARGGRSALRLPDQPGRPVDLLLHRGPRPRLPSPRDLSTDEQRAIVLHAMANHELLAVELFAWAILRFPEAPAALHRSWLATLVDEQRHVRAYVDRLTVLGVPFGTWPVSAFFWDALHEVETPLAFVAGMELGLEQANLDFAGIWAAAFRRVGDEATAEVLDMVHADEIRHVRVGAHWLRQLKEAHLDDFDAWSQALVFPLTPVRGRGPRVDRAARRAAGLDESFIERIASTASSRGRDPRVFVFDAALEDDWAGREHSPIARRVTADLAPVLAVLAAPDDVVIAEPPSSATLSRWTARGLPVPQFVPRLDPCAWPGTGTPVPWGWSPRVRRELAGIFDVPDIEGWAVLHHKTWATARLEAFASDHPRAVEPGDRGIVATTLAEVDAARATLGPGEHVVKAACSTSGQHRVRCADGPLCERARGAIRRYLDQGPVVVERWLRVVAELSTHLSIDEAVRVVGTTRFGAEGGAFRGVILGSPGLGLSARLRRALHEHRLEDQAVTAARTVGQAAQHLGYRGPLSVDALIVDDDTSVRLKPISEVNARYTMGRLGLRLKRRIAGDTGVWWFVAVRQLKRAGLSGPAALVASLPAHVVPTNEPTAARVVQTLLWSGSRWDEVTRSIADWLAGLPDGSPLRRSLGFVNPPDGP